MAGNFFRGTTVEQDGRWGKTDERLLAQLAKAGKFAAILETKIDLSKVNRDIISKWAEQKIVDLLGFEDEILINLVVNLLSADQIDGKKFQLDLTGFLEKQAGPFTAELWTLLADAQSQPSGVPSVFISKKKEELMKVNPENSLVNVADSAISAVSKGLVTKWGLNSSAISGDRGRINDESASSLHIDQMMDDAVAVVGGGRDFNDNNKAVKQLNDGSDRDTNSRREDRDSGGDKERYIHSNDGGDDRDRHSRRRKRSRSEDDGYRRHRGDDFRRPDDNRSQRHGVHQDYSNDHDIRKRDEENADEKISSRYDDEDNDRRDRDRHRRHADDNDGARRNVDGRRSSRYDDGDSGRRDRDRRRHHADDNDDGDRRNVDGRRSSRYDDGDDDRKDRDRRRHHADDNDDGDRRNVDGRRSSRYGNGDNDWEDRDRRRRHEDDNDDRSTRRHPGRDRLEDIKDENRSRSYHMAPRENDESSDNSIHGREERRQSATTRRAEEPFPAIERKERVFRDDVEFTSRNKIRQGDQEEDTHSSTCDTVDTDKEMQLRELALKSILAKKRALSSSKSTTDKD